MSISTIAAPEITEVGQVLYRRTTQYEVVRVGKNKHYCCRFVDGKRRCEWIPVEELSTEIPQPEPASTSNDHKSGIASASGIDITTNGHTSGIASASGIDITTNGHTSGIASASDIDITTNGHTSGIASASGIDITTNGHKSGIASEPSTDFPSQFRQECIEGSGIHPDLYDAAIEILDEIEGDDGNDAHLAIHEALGWRQDRHRRFVHNIKEAQQAAAFVSEDERVWQCKLKFPLPDQGGKIRKYESPSWEVSGGSRGFFPPVPASVRDRISHRWGMPVPHDGSFWQWLAKTPLMPIILTEGGKKGMCGLSEGCATIALNGAFGGAVTKDDKGRAIESTLIPDLQHFLKSGRPVYFAFDKDINPKTKAAVAASEARLGGLAESTGCTVKVLEWDKERGKGLDDFVVGGGTIDELLEDAKPGNFQGGQYKTRDKRNLKLLEKEFGNRLRLNEMSGGLELDGAELDIDEFFVDIVNEYDIEIGEGKAARFASWIGKQNSYSPVRNYLNSLPPGDPNFLNDLAHRYLSNDTPLAAKLLRRTLIAAVARVYQPGCQHDGLTVFHGKQGWNKSTFWRVLAGEWFTDDLAKEPVNEQLQLRENWIIEYSEFERAFRAKDISEMKAFVARREDAGRPRYARQTKKYPRTCLLVGTTNKNEFLHDPTGERRYWVIPVKKRIPLAEVKRDREAIWAAARTAYLEGEQWHLSFEEEAELMEATKVWKEVDPWEDDLMSMLRGRHQITIAEIFKGLDIQTSLKDSRSTRRITAILQAMGWEPQRAKKGGEVKRFWVFSGDSTVTTVTEKLEASHSNHYSGDSISTKVLSPVLSPQCHPSSSPTLTLDREAGDSTTSPPPAVTVLSPCTVTAETLQGQGFQEGVTVHHKKNGKNFSQKNKNTPPPPIDPVDGVVEMLKTFSAEGSLDLEAMETLTDQLTKEDKERVWAQLDPADRDRLKRLRDKTPTPPKIGTWVRDLDDGTLYECIGHYPGGRGEFLSRDKQCHGAVTHYEVVDYEPYLDHHDVVRVKDDYAEQVQRRYGAEPDWHYRPVYRAEPSSQVEVRRVNGPRKGNRKFTFPFKTLEITN